VTFLPGARPPLRRRLFFFTPAVSKNSPCGDYGTVLLEEELDFTWKEKGCAWTQLVPSLGIDFSFDYRPPSPLDVCLLPTRFFATRRDVLELRPSFLPATRISLLQSQSFLRFFKWQFPPPFYFFFSVIFFSFLRLSSVLDGTLPRALDVVSPSSLPVGTSMEPRVSLFASEKLEFSPPFFLFS